MHIYRFESGIQAQLQWIHGYVSFVVPATEKLQHDALDVVRSANQTGKLMVHTAQCVCLFVTSVEVSIGFRFVFSISYIGGRKLGEAFAQTVAMRQVHLRREFSGGRSLHHLLYCQSRKCRAED